MDAGGSIFLVTGKPDPTHSLGGKPPRQAILWEDMAGLVTRVFGLLALLCLVASKGAMREGENENGRKVLEAKTFKGEGFEGGMLKGRVPFWAGMARREKDETDKRKKELPNSRSSSRKRWAPKKIKKNTQKKENKGKLIKRKINKNGRKATKKNGRKDKKKNGRKATKKNGRKATKKNGRRATKNNGRKATKKNGRKTTKKNGSKATKKNGRKATKKNVRKDKKKNVRKDKKNNERKATKKNGRKATKKNGRKATKKCLSTACVDNAVKIMKLLKDRLSFYETKFRRISKKSQIASSKSGKNSVFQPALAILIDAGGGNGSALACGGNSSNAGARQMENLTEVLDQCDVNVKAACDPSGFPLPNMTEVNSCLAKGAIITDLSNNCTKLSGSLACSCWEGSNETEAAVEVTCPFCNFHRNFSGGQNLCPRPFFHRIFLGSQDLRPHNQHQGSHEGDERVQRGVWEVSELRRRRCGDHPCLQPESGHLEETAEKPESEQGSSGGAPREDCGHDLNKVSEGGS